MSFAFNQVLPFFESCVLYSRTACAGRALSNLVESLAEAKTAGNLAHRLKVLTYPALLLVDKIGYRPVSRDDAVRSSN